MLLVCVVSKVSILLKIWVAFPTILRIPPTSISSRASKTSVKFPTYTWNNYHIQTIKYNIQQFFCKAFNATFQPHFTDSLQKQQYASLVRRPPPSWLWVSPTRLEVYSTSHFTALRLLWCLDISTVDVRTELQSTARLTLSGDGTKSHVPAVQFIERLSSPSLSSERETLSWVWSSESWVTVVLTLWAASRIFSIAAEVVSDINALHLPAPWSFTNYDVKKIYSTSYSYLLFTPSRPFVSRPRAHKNGRLE